MKNIQISFCCKKDRSLIKQTVDSIKPENKFISNGKLRDTMKHKFIIVDNYTVSKNHFFLVHFFVF